MAIPSQQIGWGPQEKLLWQISKQLEKLGCQLCNVSIPGPPGPEGPINGGVGTLTVPANGFTVGDSFRVLMGGVVNAANNQTIRIKVKAGSVILLDSGIQGLTSAVTNDIWSLNVDFTIRQIGAAGVASIASLGRFSYVKTNNGAVEGFGFNTVNGGTFDTTISNTLDITVTWGSNNAGNSIYSDVFILNKTF